MSSLVGHSPPPARRRGGLWILLSVVVIALVVVVAGFFFARRQIGEFFAGKLDERLAEDGVFIAWKSADWLPGGGIRLHGLAVYRDAARRDRLALLGLVTARRPEPSFLRWDKMNFKAVDTQIVVGSGAGETRLEHMDMLLLVQPGKADLPSVSCEPAGIACRSEMRVCGLDSRWKCRGGCRSETSDTARGLVPRCESRLAEVGEGGAEVSTGEG